MRASSGLASLKTEPSFQASPLWNLTPKLPATSEVKLSVQEHITAGVNFFVIFHIQCLGLNKNNQASQRGVRKLSRTEGKPAKPSTVKRTCTVSNNGLSFRAETPKQLVNTFKHAGSDVGRQLDAIKREDRCLRVRKRF